MFLRWITNFVADGATDVTGRDGRDGDLSLLYQPPPSVLSVVQRSSAMTSPPAASRPTVLIIEDEQAIARCLAIFLDKRGFDAVIAPDASVAQGLLGVQRWDVVIVDQLLGRGPKGDEVIELAARRDPGLMDRTIFITGDITEETHERIERTGCHASLAKPFSLLQLHEKVREVVDGARATVVRNLRQA